MNPEHIAEAELIKAIDTFNSQYSSKSLTKSANEVIEAVSASIENTNIKSEELSEDEDVEAVEEPIISDFHPGTVDNPFLYDASNAELQKFILTVMFVAGKNASVQQRKVDEFIKCIRRDVGDFAVDNLGPIAALHHNYTSAEAPDKIKKLLLEVRSGQYSRLTQGICQLGDILGKNANALKDINRVNLVNVKGIGYKSASMFLMYTRRGYTGACLDIHILKYMREEMASELAGIEIPLVTPSVRRDYRKLEDLFIAHARRKGKPIAELDFEIWSKYRVRPATTASGASDVKMYADSAVV